MNERNRVQLLDKVLAVAVATMVGGLPGLAVAVTGAGFVSTISGIYKTCTRKPFWRSLIERVSANLSNQDLELYGDQVLAFLEHLERPGAHEIAVRQREAAERNQPISCASIYVQWAQEKVEQAGANLDSKARPLALRLIESVGQEIGQLSPEDAEIKAAHLVHLALSTDRITHQLNQIQVQLNNQARLQLTSPQPLRWNQGIEPINGLVFSDRLSDFTGRADELAALWAFLDDDAPLAWWQISGEGGQGKSRLALELVEDLDLTWQAGFLPVNAIDTWRAKLADKELHEPTLIVMDYISGFPEKTRLLHDLLERFSDPRWARGHKLRLLIIDRDPLPSLETKEGQQPNLQATWLQSLDERQRDRLVAAAYKQDKPCLPLEPLTGEILLEIAQSWRARMELSPLPKAASSQFIRTLERDRGLRRPLFAIILALTFDADTNAEDEKDSPSSMEDLLHKAFALQQRQWGEGPNPDDQGADRLAVLATFCGRLKLRQFQDLGIDPKSYGLTADRANNRTRLTAAYKRLGRTVVAQADKEDPPLKGLTPDILGEYFILNWIEEQKAVALFDQSGLENVTELLDDCWKVNSAAALATLARAWQDFRGSDRLRPALETLQQKWPALTSVGLIAASQAGLHILLDKQAKRDKEINGHLLLIGAALGHIEVVQVMLKNGASPTWIHEPSGTFPLLIAAQNGHTDVVKALLDCGADPNQIDPGQGGFPLLLAAENGHLGVVQILLDTHADPNQFNPTNGAFPLIMATQGGYFDVVQVLLNRDANPNQVDQETGGFSLLMASHHGQVEVVQVLLNKGANPNQIAVPTGASPLLIASQNGHVEVVQTLLGWGANISQIVPAAGTFPLLIASVNGRVDVVRVLLDEGADPNQIDPETGMSPLLVASQNDHVDVVQILLKNGAKPKEVNPISGVFPLFMASQKGYVRVVQALLDRGADPNQVDPMEGNFPLLQASQNGQVEVVQALLEHGAEPSQFNQRNGAFSLVMASQQGYAKVVQALLEHGADPNQAEPREGAFPLILATQNSHAEVVQALLCRGADPNQVAARVGEFPLLRAAENGHVEIVQVLLDGGAEPNQVNLVTGAFPLLMAAQGGHSGVVRLLLEKGAKVDKTDSMHGGFSLLQASLNDHEEVIDILLEWKANPNRESPTGGDFPLILAAEKNCINAVRALLKGKAAVNKKNTLKKAQQYGTFPLLMAARNGHLDVVKALIDAGANLNMSRKKTGNFPLQNASQNGHVEVVQELLYHGANLNQVNLNTGAFPLLVAAMNNHVAVVELLLARGANWNKVTHHGHTALDVAKQERHQEVVDLLIAAGTKKT